MSNSVDSRNIQPVCVWNEKVSNTEIEKFRKKVEEKYNKKFESYWDLYKWSVENFADFWEEIWHYFKVISSKPYDEVFVKTGDGLLDNQWFTGATFNFAENVLRIRDDREAIIYYDETGFEEIVTFAQMFEEVKLYASAFRKFGLQKEDRVACCMSNRKEAIFAFLAAVSIGAIFGGPQPYFGAKAASNIINKMEPKFLISIDHHQDNEENFSCIDNLEEIINNCPTLEKVIIVATKQETLSRDISNIQNSYLLDDFLKCGKNSDGSVPDLVFEQLPFNHPICINFTSGTSGLPKGPVHSAGVGWTLWDTFIPCFAWGIKLFLSAVCPYNHRKGKTIWDLFARYKVTYAFLPTSVVDKLENMNIVPSPDLDLGSLKFLTMGGSPVKPQNCLFIKDKVRNIFTCSQYGATETFGTFSGFDLNLPSYAGEIQLPGLGMDVKCFDEDGNSVINKRGEMVIVTPTPTLPISIWKDDDNNIIRETYLSKYPGVWCHHDEIWINPVTRGIVVIGRSDDTLKQYGDRFGSGDIYSAIHDVEEILDYICVGQNKYNGDTRAVLFVKMKEGYKFTPEFNEKLKEKISKELWVECVPEVILETKGIPYNFNNKKMESIVRAIVATNEIPDVNNLKNPECLANYCNIQELLDYNKK